MTSKFSLFNERGIKAFATYGNIRYLEMPKEKRGPWALAFRSFKYRMYWLSLDLPLQETISYESFLRENCAGFDNPANQGEIIAFVAVFVELGGTLRDLAEWRKTIGWRLWSEPRDVLRFVKMGLGPADYEAHRKSVSMDNLEKFINAGYTLNEYLFVSKLSGIPLVAAKVVKRLIEKGYKPGAERYDEEDEELDLV